MTTNNSVHRLPVFQSSAAATGESTNTSYLLAVVDGWLTCNLEPLLWIPPLYRSNIVATNDQAIALGLQSGHILTMSFDFSSRQPWEDAVASSALTPSPMNPWQSCERAT
jgi:hypothetical protein